MNYRSSVKLQRYTIVRKDYESEIRGPLRTRNQTFEGSSSTVLVTSQWWLLNNSCNTLLFQKFIPLHFTTGLVVPS